MCHAAAMIRSGLFAAVVATFAVVACASVPEDETHQGAIRPDVDTVVPQAKPGAPPCNPTTCKKLHVTCGAEPDGCGGVIQCGLCVAPQTCSAGRCIMCTPRTCADVPATCG